MKKLIILISVLVFYSCINETIQKKDELSEIGISIIKNNKNQVLGFDLNKNGFKQAFRFNSKTEMVEKIYSYEKENLLNSFVVNEKCEFLKVKNGQNNPDSLNNQYLYFYPNQNSLSVIASKSSPFFLIKNLSDTLRKDSVYVCKVELLNKDGGKINLNGLKYNKSQIDIIKSIPISNNNIEITFKPIAVGYISLEGYVDDETILKTKQFYKKASTYSFFITSYVKD